MASTQRLRTKINYWGLPELLAPAPWAPTSLEEQLGENILFIPPRSCKPEQPNCAFESFPFQLSRSPPKKYCIQHKVLALYSWKGTVNFLA